MPDIRIPLAWHPAHGYVTPASPETSPQLAERIATAAWVAVPLGPFHQEDAPETPLEPTYLANRADALSQYAALQSAERAAGDVYRRADFRRHGEHGDKWSYEQAGVAMAIPASEVEGERPFVQVGAWKFPIDTRRRGPWWDPPPSVVDGPYEVLEEVRRIFEVAVLATGALPIGCPPPLQPEERRNGNWTARYLGVHVTANPGALWRQSSPWAYAAWMGRLTINGVYVYTTSDDAAPKPIFDEAFSMIAQYHTSAGALVPSTQGAQ